MQEVSWPGWETVRVLGRGSYGAVYEIQRDVLGLTEKAALKVISIPQNESEVDELYRDGYDKENIIGTFQTHLKNIVNEYSLMRQMNGCSNIVHCDDVRYVPKEDGIGWDIYIKMELLQPLADALPAQIPEKTVIQVGKDICRALEICGKHNVIHRDIKPQNMFYSPNGDYKLGDFGIAKTVGNATRGTVIGTFKYMAPEVYSNKPYGAGADIYSLGLVLYWMLNHRRLPFMPLPPAQLMAGMDGDAANRRLMGEPIPAPAGGSEELKRIVLKACAYDPDQRYASASEMLRDLERLEWMPAAVPVSPEPANKPQPIIPKEPDATIRVRKTQPDMAPRPEPPVTVAPPRVKPAREKKKISWALILGLIGILIAVAVIAVEILFIVKKAREEEPTPPATTVQPAYNDALAKYQYVATSSIFVNNSAASLSGNASLDMSSAEITSARSLVDTYVQLIEIYIRSEECQQMLQEKFPNAQYTVEVSTVPNTQVVEISVCSEIYQNNLAAICQEITANAPLYVSNIVEGSSTRIISLAKQPPETPTEPQQRGNYSEFVKIYVDLASGEAGVTITNRSDLQSLVGTYCYIITSPETTDELKDYSEYSHFTIKATPINDTRVIEITAFSDDESSLPAICEAICQVVPHRIENIVEGSSVKIVHDSTYQETPQNTPTEPTKPPQPTPTEPAKPAPTEPDATEPELPEPDTTEPPIPPEPPQINDDGAIILPPICG